jgi:hypothetical protein
MPSVAAPAGLIAREERVIAALHRLMAEQNHLLQEHRQQLAALIDRASRSRAPQAPGHGAGAHSLQRTAPPPIKSSQASPPIAARSVAQAASSEPGGRAMGTPSPWSSPAAVTVATPVVAQRPLHTTQVLAENSGFWARLGRGFVSTFSPAYKD